MLQPRPTVIDTDPGLDDAVSESLVRVVNALRALPLRKAPSVSETIDWAQTLLALGGRLDDDRSHGAVVIERRAVTTARDDADDPPVRQKLKKSRRSMPASTAAASRRASMILAMTLSLACIWVSLSC